jgi:aspartyl-tRNA(Asn)/glutamyl-tRNA(Gln) amidotransferase subunit B
MLIKGYEIVIGLEIHVQLNTLSKAFCADRNSFGDTPNTHVSAVSLAHPGTLPVMNSAHLYKAVTLGIALDSELNQTNIFDRKNYFYPDLPKGYQITQDKIPFCKGGIVKFESEGQIKSIRLHHIHMEEDAGKLIHDGHPQYTLTDYNRAGVPLLEIVTEPDFRSGTEVSDFLSELQRIVQYLDISDANMEEGSFRCDCNVSVRPVGETALGERCEIKNLNSRKFAKAAIEYEANRQISEIESGGKIHKTTMLYNPETNTTRAMRKKENENDYRYFPEPDLPPVVITDSYIADIRSKRIMLPLECNLKLQNAYGLNKNDADLLCESRNLVEWYFNICKLNSSFKEIADLIILKIIPYAKSQNKQPDSLKSSLEIAEFISFISSGKASKSAIYQHLFPVWIATENADILNLAEKSGILQSENQSFLDTLIEQVIAENKDKVKEYRSGKKGLIGFFMGQVKQLSEGKADPIVMKDKLTSKLDNM